MEPSVNFQLPSLGLMSQMFAKATGGAPGAVNRSYSHLTNTGSSTGPVDVPSPPAPASASPMGLLCAVANASTCFIPHWPGSQPLGFHWVAFGLSQ